MFTAQIRFLLIYCSQTAVIKINGKHFTFFVNYFFVTNNLSINEPYKLKIEEKFKLGLLKRFNFKLQLFNLTPYFIFK